MQRRGRVFSYEEAMALFPVVRDRTAAAVRELDELVAEAGRAAGPEAVEPSEAPGTENELEHAYRAVVERWAEEIQSLGCHVKGLWLVDWDSGDGFFCWKHPEPALGHFHGYDEGFANRIPIA